MWLNRTRLPHVLPKEAYFAPAHHARELAQIFRPGWHCVGSIDDVPDHGDVMNRSLLGAPLLVRNHQGVLSAVADVNLDGHRPALLTDEAQRRSYRTERLGKLIFVSLTSEGPSLREQLGHRSYTLGERLFSPRVRQVVAKDIPHPCNWKIPLENVLESYHVPVLHNNPLSRHPGLFKVFTGRRSASSKTTDGMPPADSVHELDEQFSAYYDSLGGDSRLYRSLIERLRPGASCDYVHHHCFPNLIFGNTSIVSFVQAVVPLSPTTSQSMIRLFLELDERGAHRLAFGRLASPFLKQVAARLIEMVLREDAAVYPAVQRGMEASVHAGVLGSREERVHAFQTYVARACGLGLSAP